MQAQDLLGKEPFLKFGSVFEPELHELDILQLLLLSLLTLLKGHAVLEERALFLPFFFLS